ncbi:hypothetical protein J4412_01600 [Candidatus Pacearchaeota archaeon]|nr:MAG: hypothetical protein QJ16_C0003G0030 [archaeon GW2011_AR1]MBS3078182.1 hypothetical protein [Candidatus Pacearchaeota archaeon]HIH52272.1 hypothetical protein [Nanoarchaeota archaeon]
MKVKVKKQNEDGIVRLESSGSLKEILINEDFLNPNDESIAICFRGKNSSGMIELTPKEFEILAKEIEKKNHLFKEFKVMKFKK